MNIITDKLTPSSIGEFIDALIIINIRMWHAQEVVYETETLEKMTKDEMFAFLKSSTWLNLQRNFMMDGLDKTMQSEFIDNSKKEVLPKGKSKIFQDDTIIWEQL